VNLEAEEGLLASDAEKGGCEADDVNGLMKYLEVLKLLRELEQQVLDFVRTNR